MLNIIIILLPDRCVVWYLYLECTQKDTLQYQHYQLHNYLIFIEGLIQQDCVCYQLKLLL